MHGGTVPAGSDFYPRPPRGGRLDLLQSSLHEIMISIHALREEGDLGLRYEGDNAKVFLSTPSARRATLVYGRQRRGKLISIHALREEGDTCLPACAPFTPSNFYPRPPRGGRRGGAPQALPLLLFLSTPSARRATRFCPVSTPFCFNFYPRPPRGGRLYLELAKFTVDLFLSTPSARRATFWFRHPRFCRSDFYPRPPRGGRRVTMVRDS